MGFLTQQLRLVYLATCMYTISEIHVLHTHDTGVCTKGLYIYIKDDTGVYMHVKRMGVYTCTKVWEYQCLCNYEF